MTAEDRNALAARHLKLAYHIARRLYRTQPAVTRLGTQEDVEQEAVLGLLLACGSLSYDAVKGAPSTYLYHCIRRHVLNAAWSGALLRVPASTAREARLGTATRGTAEAVRRAGRFPGHLDPLRPRGADRAAPEPAEEDREAEAGLHAALRKLPAMYRDALARNYGLGGRERQTGRQIAADLGVTDRTVDSRIHRGKRMLRTLLSA